MQSRIALYAYLLDCVILASSIWVMLLVLQLPLCPSSHQLESISLHNHHPLESVSQYIIPSHQEVQALTV